MSNHKVDFKVRLPERLQVEISKEKLATSQFLERALTRVSAISEEIL